MIYVFDNRIIFYLQYFIMTICHHIISFQIKQQFYTNSFVHDSINIYLIQFDYK